jgi:hypothetical protein
MESPKKGFRDIFENFQKPSKITKREKRILMDTPESTFSIENTLN